MADKAGQADIRSLQIDKGLKGFADELLVFKNELCTVTPTKAREVRWFQKTAGFLDTSDSTGITASQIPSVAFGARPKLMGPSFTRNTSYVEQFFVESEWISEQDIKDNDVDILGTTIRDLVKGVAFQVNTSIWNVITEDQTPNLIHTVTTTAAWDAGSGQDPIEDLLECFQNIDENNYDSMKAVILLSPKDYKSLINWIISDNGSNIPGFSSALVGGKSLQAILGRRIIVSNSVTADKAGVGVPKVIATWKTFTNLTSAVKIDELIGRKVRVKEEGICLLTDPKAMNLIENTQT